MNNNALSVANEFIDLAHAESNNTLTPLKLIKLVYLAHGFGLVFLEEYNKMLIDPRFDKVEAWKFGPVIPSVYHTFKHLQNSLVTIENKAIVIENEEKLKFITPQLDGELEKKIVRFVWNRYKDLSGSELVTLLHRDGTPWALSYEEGQNNEIPDFLTKTYYKMVVENLKKGNTDND